MHYLPAIFALLVAAAGWYYMFYSTAAQKLAGIEQDRHNHLRVRLRRIGGGVIMFLAIAFYALFAALRDERAGTALLLLAVVVACMVVILVLGWIDLRLTRHWRRERRK